jgi:Uma2 family endonuclease
MAIVQLLTIADYESLTERLAPELPTPELIDGSLIMPAARPSRRHMRYMRFILKSLESYIDAYQLKGEILLEFEVALDAHTILIPDIAYRSDDSTLGRMTEQRLYGAPDFVCEIASPSTRVTDAQEKYLAFLRAGVKEYWIVDPDNPAGKRFILYERVGGTANTDPPTFQEIAGNDPKQSRTFPGIQIDASLL